MSALLAFLLGAASVVTPLAQRFPDTLRRRYVLGGLVAAVSLAGCVAALGVLRLGLGGVLLGLAVPVAWVAWEAGGDGRWSPRGAAVSAVARGGVALVALVLVGVLHRPPVGPAGRGALVVAWVGVAVFMTEPANRLVNAVLALAGVPGSTAEGRVEPGTRAEGDDPAPSLRGGHWIGALERLLLILLAMNGAEIPAAVIIAAKGVVRFPEISQPGGRAAEVFLVGSMASWTLAVLGVMLLRTV